MTPDLEAERIKIRFIGAYERLQQRGLITEKELEEVIQLLDRLDEVDEAQLRTTLGRFQALQEPPGGGRRNDGSPQPES
ncbi:hypothetical protein [Limnochorda pilosa]|uniref:Uncharacterized protein n=1 Tax=Limnochorda pilosa TaxID=1555112 RepID=A0A0K2SQP3_LIMPI|nr:hypothetical protein [Limnochorda pilosa]BAS29426.1 hypothetical protein LIP_3618 [Limnochorda pilosa]